MEKNNNDLKNTNNTSVSLWTCVDFRLCAGGRGPGDLRVSCGHPRGVRPHCQGRAMTNMRRSSTPVKRGTAGQRRPRDVHFLHWLQVSPLFYKDPSCLSNRFAERNRLLRERLFWNNKKRLSTVSLKVFLSFLSCNWWTSAWNL